MKKLKKILSIIIAIMVLMTAMPVLSASADGDEHPITTDAPYEMCIDDAGEYVKFTPETDGWYKFYTEGDYDTYAELYNSNWDSIIYNDDSHYGLNFCINYKLYAGYTYYLFVNAYLDYDELAEFTLIAEESVGVEEVTITKEPDDNTVVEHYEESTLRCDGLEATFTLSDGTTVDWSYNDYDMVNGEYVDITINNDGYDHYYIDIICEEAFTRYFYTTVETLVDYITYNGPLLEFYENTHGYYVEEEDQYYYTFNLPYDATVTVYYKDGTSYESTIYEQIDGVYIDIYDDQSEVPWVLGSDNYITLDYLGGTTTIPVTILPCPFVNVTVNSTPSKEYIYGDCEFGEMNGDSYYFIPEDLTGLSFTVEYEDGTTQTYDDNDIDMQLEEIDGYEYTINGVYATATGVVEATLNYKGYEIKYDINVIDTPVADIEFLVDPNDTEYESLYYPVLDGMKVQITYTDGTSETITINEENTEYILNNNYIYSIATEKGKLDIIMDYDDSFNEIYIFRTFGYEKAYTGFTFTETRAISSIDIDKFTTDGDGMVITVNYEDGTSETLTFDTIAINDYDYGYYENYALTDNGILYYSISPDYDDEDNIVGYDVFCLGSYIYVDAPSYTLGDVNDDGEINIVDASMVQMQVARYAVEGLNFDAADIDQDGEITIRDATTIQMYVTKYITEF